MPTGYAELRGNLRVPELHLTFQQWTPHPTWAKTTLLDWVRTLPGRRFDKTTQKWIVTGLGADPDKILADAGFEIIYPSEGELAGIDSLNRLVAPVTMLARDRHTVLVRHRLAGFDRARELIGPAATWDKDRSLFLMPVADVLIRTAPGQYTVRPDVIWGEGVLEQARAVHDRVVVAPEYESLARKLSAAVNAQDVTVEITQAQVLLGAAPDAALYGYQQAGHLAVALGHTGLFDAPGVGKTRQFLAAAKALNAARTLVIVPPLVLTNWGREAVAAGLATPEHIVTFRPGRKEPQITPDTRVVIVSDSLLASRPHLGELMVEWAPNTIGFDEAHRAKTIGSKRGEAVLAIARALPAARTVAITGTPIFGGPHEIVPLLDFTGHLAPVFGGPSAFLTRYCRQDKFGGWHARKEHLAELKQLLVEHVWVRRTKAQVLPDLPEKLPLQEVAIDVNLTGYKQAHKDVITKVRDWLDRNRDDSGALPDDAVIDEYAKEALPFVSQLRRAAGLAKVAGATEHIQNFIEATQITHPDGRVEYPRPLIVWAHHTDVVNELADALRAHMPIGVVTGQTPSTERDRIVDAFQAGELAVFLGGITAAGVGITLVKSSDVLFVETDWTPALMTQAIDRAHRIGQQRSVSVEILIAPGTLDEHIQKVLLTKGDILDAALGDDGAHMAVTQIDRGDLATAEDIIRALIDEARRGMK